MVIPIQDLTDVTLAIEDTDEDDEEDEEDLTDVTLVSDDPIEDLKLSSHESYQVMKVIK